ncbi:MAG TPA: FtsX-like permease family protein [Thermomicrobiales bacterium]|nr:FtsX-like permease family protein [Thermomicrobiales bacterium]
MDNIFGLSMNTVLIVCVTIMSLCLLTTAIIALRNRVIFKMAIRNIPRRKAQTVLIMIGLMLSTLIIAASLTTGDTLDYSMTKSSYDGLGQVDETIAFVGDTDNEGEISASNLPIDASIADQLQSRFADDPDIDAVMPVLTVGAPVVNTATQLSEPQAVITGVDPARLDDFGGLTSTGGEALDLASMPEGAVVISEDLAESTEAQVGDELTLFYENQPHTVIVGGIANGSILTGYTETVGQAGPASNSGADLLGVAVPLDWLQELTGLEGQARFIAVSNSGGVEGGVDQSDASVAKLTDALAEIDGGEQLGVNPVKQDAIEGAEMAGNTFMTFFMLFGLFSIAAGVLLIFLIFMMLAAERRSEMGMARAVGMKRSHLIQQFIAEGTAYDLGAALIGAALGVGVAFAIATLMANLFGGVIDITPYASLCSLTIAYALGVTVTFLTIIFASVRSSQLNIVAAIRDLPDNAAPGTHERPRWRWWNKLPRFGIASTIVSLPLELIWNVVLAPVKLVVWLVRLLAHAIGWSVIIALVGVGFLLLGVTAVNMFTFSLGLSLLVLGLVLFLRRFLPARHVFTTGALLMLLYWLLPPNWTAPVLPNVGDGGPEMLFVSGVFMVAYTTMIIMWNADLIVGSVALLGRSASRWLPAVKTAVAYPLASKGRTGMTVAMFAMVIFSLVTVKTISANFAELFTTDDADAGWDITVETSTANPIDDLTVELVGSEVDLDRIAAVGTLEGITYPNSQVRNPGEQEWSNTAIRSLDQSFIENAEIPLEARAPGYESDAAVWDALKAGQDVAVIDSIAFEGDDFGSGSNRYVVPDGIELDDESIPAFEVELYSARTGETQAVTVIGLIDSQVSTMTGLFLPQPAFDELYGQPDISRVYVRLTDHQANDAGEVAKDIEAALLTSGVQAESIREAIDEDASFANGFFQLLQGFMGMGLLVGIAALGVISFRSVVERRQQIGMLRAIGYQRNMVAASFLIESIVVAMLGVISGTFLAIVLSYNLINSNAFGDGQTFETFVIPWGTVVFFIAASLVAAAVMTWVPARKASSVPIAEALRYE